MKKLIISFLALVMFGCSERGEITKQPEDFIIIHGKTYKLMRIVPCKSCDGIWIMYPKDSLDEIPTSINYNVQSGKANHNKTIIQVR